MLTEIAVGDAYGAGFENAPRNFIQKYNEMEYVNHPRKLRKKPESYNPSLVPAGAYTDDTQMSLAIAEAMLEDDPWTVESLADRFVEVFKRNPRRGYTPYFLMVLMNSEDGTVMRSKIRPNSTKSGAAMRAGVIGMYSDMVTVIKKAKIQASVTHDSWLGKNSAVGAALMTHYFYHKLGPRENLVEWLRDNYFGDTIHSSEPFEIDGQVVHCWTPTSGKKVRVHAWDCLEAALHAIESHDNLKDILSQCISYGGDVDTVAAIAMGPAGCAQDIEWNLPDNLLEDLESGDYGRDYLERLDQKLYRKFPRSKN